MEKRRFRRVSFHAMATLQVERGSISGMVENLSIKGMFLNTKESLPEDGLLDISIILSGTSSLLSIKAKGIVVRRDESGVAVEFQEMDMDSFVHLRNIVAFNTGDADAFHEECRRALSSN